MTETPNIREVESVIMVRQDEAIRDLRALGFDLRRELGDGRPHRLCSRTGLVYGCSVALRSWEGPEWREALNEATRNLARVVVGDLVRFSTRLAWLRAPLYLKNDGEIRMGRPLIILGLRVVPLFDGELHAPLPGDPALDRWKVEAAEHLVKARASSCFNLSPHGPHDGCNGLAPITVD